jgi:DNA-binding NtrC family response regulator
MSSSVADSASGLIGQSVQIAATRHLIQKAARNRLPVLLLGESGTGKEVVARAIHTANPRGPFVPIDCGSLVGTLMESELFGHVKGSFSGADENKKGLVEVADGGTAFFDEIGDLPFEMQVKLLRVIQEREFRPIGALKARPVDIRIIAATHRDLKAEVAAGRFRHDLFYRLNVLVIHLAPLREHREDIPLLVQHFLEQARQQGLPELAFPPELEQTVLSYDWPGNVRELKNCIDRLAAVSSAGALQMADMPSALQNYQAASSPQAFAAAAAQDSCPSFLHAPLSPVISIHDCEKKAIQRALVASGGERKPAAQALGIGRTTLYRKMKQYGIA